MSGQVRLNHFISFMSGEYSLLYVRTFYENLCQVRPAKSRFGQVRPC